MEPLRLVEIWGDPGEVPVRTVADFLGDALSGAARAYLARDTARSRAGNEEDLHQARVSLRRIRSYLRTFRSVVDPIWASAVRAELGWFGGLLGEVRNLDVMAGRISRREDNGDDLAGYKELLAAAEVERAAALTDVAQARELPRYQSVRSYVDALANREVRFGVGASEEAATATARILRRPWRAVRDAAKTARRAPTETNLHVLRIRSKELRYAAEISREFYGVPASRLARAAQGVQDRLGEHRDALSTAEFAHRAAMEHPSCAYAAGQFVVMERLAAERSLEGLGGDLRRLRSVWRDFERSSANRKG